MTLKILIVEDEALIAQELEAVLTAAGFAIAGVAPSVAKALALIAERQFDTAILDASLRGHSAEPVAQTLRHSGTPFLVLSGYSHAHLTGALLDVPHLTKPIRPEALVRAIRALTES
jgi:DNA-binding response OmpR family regulator